MGVVDDPGESSRHADHQAHQCQKKKSPPALIRALKSGRRMGQTAIMLAFSVSCTRSGSRHMYDAPQLLLPCCCSFSAAAVSA
jgi:hypothetical protein